MASLFSSPPKPPKPKTPPNVPSPTDAATQEAAAEALRKRQRAKGYRATILSNLMESAVTQGQQTTIGR